MRSPPFSSEVSDSTDRRDSPADEVDSLLSTALQITELDSNLDSIFAKHKHLFLDVFSRQIELIRSRSQALEDAHVTVYDRVLLALTRNGNDLEEPAAITWYAMQYLGFNPEGGAARNTQFIEQGLALSVAIHKDQDLPEYTRDSSSVPAVDQLLVAEDKTSQISNDPVFSRLWNVYEKARAEYFETVNGDNFRAGETARFLRDTAENGLHYLADHPNQDTRLHKDLTETYKMASRAVEKLCGGRKRKFDYARDKDRNSRLVRRPAKSFSHTSSKLPVHHGKAGLPAKPPTPGRGHSGVPYGYSKARNVDSYVPSRG